MLWRVAARLHVGSTSSRLQPSLSDHHRSLLVLDALLEQLDVLVHVEDLLKNLRRSTAITPAAELPSMFSTRSL